MPTRVTEQPHHQQSVAHPGQERLPFPKQVYKPRKPTTSPASTFDFQYFKKITDLQKMHDYADQTLGQHRCGSSRCMWMFRVGKKLLALKLAVSHTGIIGGGPIGQNRKEVEASECVKGSPNFTHVIKHDPKFVWIVAELADMPFDKANFGRFTGISWDKFEYYGARGLGGLHELEQLFPDNPWITALINDVEACDIDPRDFHDQNWGQVDRRPVIVDYGFTG